MSEHKRNPTAIYFKENLSAADFRPLFGKRKPRGKGIRRVYKILMKRQGESRATLGEVGEERAGSGENIMDSQKGKENYRHIKSKNFENLVSASRQIFSKVRCFLSSFRRLYLPLVKR